MSTTLQARPRLAGIDKLRGLAIALMVLDHVLVHVHPTSDIRYTATRLALPAFIACAAAVRPPGRPLGHRRLALLLAACIAEAVLGPAASLGTPGPVALITGVLLVAPLLDRNPALFATLGFIQGIYVAPKFGPHWGGYQPGIVCMWWCIARLIRPADLQQLERLPGALATIGRHPIAWYLGHLAVIALVWPA